MKQIRIAVVTPVSARPEVGGAEHHFRGLLRALNRGNVAADHIQVESDESNFDSILEAYLRFYELDLSAYDGVISTKGPTYMVRHPNHICWLLHTIRVFYDMFENEFSSPTPELLDQRNLIIQADTLALSPPHTKKVFVNGAETGNRLRKYNGLDSTVLHPPLEFDWFHFQRGDRGYAFIASRLHRWKRIDLAIRAMRHVSAPMELVIAGSGEDEDRFRELAKGDPRVRFLGYVSDEEIVEWYTYARVVPFTPLREDFGYVTLEAFRSGKPVITCEDSGEPARLVKHGVSGFVVKPEPSEIGRFLQYLWDHPEVAREMGRKGMESTQHIRWDVTRQHLLSALGFCEG
jgi:glycosyltransferase involved in cell wall biosynthesis